MNYYADAGSPRIAIVNILFVEELRVELFCTFRAYPVGEPHFGMICKVCL